MGGAVTCTQSTGHWGLTDGPQNTKYDVDWWHCVPCRAVLDQVWRANHFTLLGQTIRITVLETPSTLRTHSSRPTPQLLLGNLFLGIFVIGIYFSENIFLGKLTGGSFETYHICGPKDTFSNIKGFRIHFFSKGYFRSTRAKRLRRKWLISKRRSTDVTLQSSFYNVDQGISGPYSLPTNLLEVNTNLRFKIRLLWTFAVKFHSNAEGGKKNRPFLRGEIKLSFIMRLRVYQALTVARFLL